MSSNTDNTVPSTIVGSSNAETITQMIETDPKMAMVALKEFERKKKEEERIKQRAEMAIKKKQLQEEAQAQRRRHKLIDEINAMMVELGIDVKLNY